MTLRHLATCTALLVALLLGACASHTPRGAALPDGSRADFTILETTDLHSHVLGFDYYRLQADPTQGLARAATLIDKARRQYPNSILLDAGDTIQGSVLADYQALVEPVPCDQELAVYRAMDRIGYDGGTIGNHEFNYGLSYLAQVTGTPFEVAGVPSQNCRGPHYPLVLSNVFSRMDGQPLFKPWTIIHETLRATRPDGSTVEAPLSIGLLGFAPPQIMQWDKQNLEGRVTVMGLVEAARKYLPQLQAQHPDLVVAIVHGGLGNKACSPELTNAATCLAQVPGIDAMMLGHQHRLFPGPDFADIEGVDDERGTVGGVPAVMAGMFGKDIGLVHLELSYRNGQWLSDPAAAWSETWPICPDEGRCVAPNPAIARMLAAVQQGTIDYVTTPIGRSDFRMSSYFADLGDVTALVPVMAAQRARVVELIAENHPELAGIPVLSAAAAFRTGFAGADDYTDVAAGPLTIRSAADLYYYPNTLVAVKIDGAGLKAWLEHAAGRFNRIDPDKTTPQALVNPRFEGYNFDQIGGPGLHYVIDVSEPRGQRITSLTLHGQPIEPDQSVIVVTNNYRASGGGGFPGLDGSASVIAPEATSRKVLIQWLKAQGTLGRRQFKLNPWDFAPLDTRGLVTVISARGKLDVAHADGLDGVTLLRDHGDGSATYAIDL